MKIQIQDLSKSQKELSITIEVDELNPFINKVIDSAKQNLELKGFRKGKIPSGIAKEKFSEEEVFNQAAELAVKEYYSKAVKENNLEVVGNPEIQIVKIAKGNPLEFKAKVWIMPEISLPDYKKISSGIKEKEILVQEKDIEETLKWLQRSRAVTSPKQGSCQKGDFVEISYSSPLIEQGKENKDSFVMGQSYLLPEFEDNLMGMKENEEKEFSVTFPKEYFKKELAQKKADFKLKLLKVQNVELPEINDQWAKTLGNFENLNQLKESIKQGIQKEKEDIEKQKVQAEILEKIAEKTECLIPKILIDAELERTVEEMKKKIPEMLKMSFEKYLEQTKLSEEGFKKSLIPDIEKKIKKFLILREIRKRESIEAPEEEIRKEADKFLAQFKTVEQAEDVIDSDALQEYTKERIESQKTLEFLGNLSKEK